MTTLQLTKHHGLGNDFLVVFHPPVPPARLPALAVALCDRRTGIGADGLLVAESEPGMAARMWLYNADGSRAEMSGNGIRCFAQALALRRGDLDGQTILTDAGDRHVRLVATDRADTIEASVDMGEIRAGSEPEGWAGSAPTPIVRCCTSTPATRTRSSASTRSPWSTSRRSAHTCRAPTSRSSSRATSRTSSACSPRARRWHHPGLRHRRAPAPRPGRGGWCPPPRRKSSCRWTADARRFVSTTRRPAGPRWWDRRC
ncbi:MAG: hypothetical protein R2713_00940 [Ilumatobacteraceae bacterium]